MKGCLANFLYIVNSTYGARRISLPRITLPFAMSLFHFLTRRIVKGAATLGGTDVLIG